MSEEVIGSNSEEREKLAPIVGMVIGCYIAIMTLGYFLGNAIYQIP